MNNQKKFAPVIITLIIVALLIGGILTWQFWPKEVIPPPVEIIPEEGNWKTFNHPFYNFGIGFPSDWGGTVDGYIWAPGTIGLSSEELAFCPPYYETCTSPSAPGGPISIDGPILLFICVEGSWKSPDVKCKTEEDFNVHYYNSIWKPEIEEAIKRANLSYWEVGGRTVRAELILFDSAYEAVFNNMALTFKESITEDITN